jgi:O-methyltransferase
MKTFRSSLKLFLPHKLIAGFRAVENLGIVVSSKEDRCASIRFLRKSFPNVSTLQKMALIAKNYWTSARIESPHSQKEILSFIETILTLPISCRGVVVEAGCFKGSSTSKFSLAAALAGRQLVVFDSFEGIPANTENHGKNIFGGEALFDEGDYHGAFEEVKNNIRKYGDISVCRFVKGWLDQTLPDFSEPIAAAYIDVDLASSTRTCLKYLYPLLEPTGFLYSQDGHLPLVIDVLKDENFWLNEVGFQMPLFEGIGSCKLVKARKN